ERIGGCDSACAAQLRTPPVRGCVRAILVATAPAGRLAPRRFFRGLPEAAPAPRFAPGVVLFLARPSRGYRTWPAVLTREVAGARRFKALCRSRPSILEGQDC